ncbi:MAG: hypothetical protein JOZ54_22445 [Acidobacteria bacterium]|nr:hypothetical protein [Acidobacteriota bacterium]
MKSSTPLDNLVRTGQLKAEPRIQADIDALVQSGRARLADAMNEALSMESRFDLAYNAAHALSLAALRWHGYRAQNRFVVFQCLAHTLGLSPERWRVLDEAHRKRNVAEYEGPVEIDQHLVAALLRVTSEVADRMQGLLDRPR